MNVNEWLHSELGVNIWNNKYRHNNETFEGWLDRVSGGCLELKELIRGKKFLFGGRILSNRGLHRLGKKVTYSNCYVLEPVGDSIEGIYQTCSDLARTFSYGGGVGIDISKLRPVGTKVNNTAEMTSGAVSFMDTFSKVAETIGQNGRRGALMISIDCNHPELLEFIDVKNDLSKVTKANISVKVTNEFMKAVEDNSMYKLTYKFNDGTEFVNDVHARDVFKKLCENNWRMAEPGILFWDTITKYNLLSEDADFTYAGVNPCAEEPLPAGGSCLLGSINLDAYVNRDTKTFNFIDFASDIPTIVRAMNDVLDEGLPLHPLDVQKGTVRDYRQIGIGIMGLADMLIHLGIEYGSKAAVEICDKIGFLLANRVIESSSILAESFGHYPKYSDCVRDSNYYKCHVDKFVDNLVKNNGLRNSQLLTIAPTGSISTMLGISGGIEPIFDLTYQRKTESLHGEDVYYDVNTSIVEEYMQNNNIDCLSNLPDYFVTSKTINPKNRIDMQSVWQKHIDASISSTVNLTEDYTVEDIEDLYMYAWKSGLKGMTVYRDNCDRAGILTSSGDKSSNTDLKHGDWLAKPLDTIYHERKVQTGCSKLILFIGYSKSEDRLVDLFVKHTTASGCKSNIDALCISMSGMLRLGGSLKNIEKALEGCGVCPSYVRAKDRGVKISPGYSCPTAILRALQDFMKDTISLEPAQIPSKRLEINLNKVSTLCPDCGAELSFSGGCCTCNNCGYSKCN